MGRLVDIRSVVVGVVGGGEWVATGAVLRVVISRWVSRVRVVLVRIVVMEREVVVGDGEGGKGVAAKGMTPFSALVEGRGSDGLKLVRGRLLLGRLVKIWGLAG